MIVAFCFAQATARLWACRTTSTWQDFDFDFDIRFFLRKIEPARMMLEKLVWSNSIGADSERVFG